MGEALSPSVLSGKVMTEVWEVFREFPFGRRREGRINIGAFPMMSSSGDVVTL